MTERERFLRVFRGEPVDRIPLYYFGSWVETKQRWADEGLGGGCLTGDCGPQLPWMDTDWECGMWGTFGLVNLHAFGDQAYRILEDTEDYYIEETPIGLVQKVTKKGSSVRHTLKYPLEPTRESWEHFKTFLRADDPRRVPAYRAERIQEVASRDFVGAFFGGSLYGWMRDWMGVEELSVMMYEEPELLKEMVDFLADFFIEVYRPFLKDCHFEFAYIFEDCCGSHGPLFGPSCFDRIYRDAYTKLIRFYKEECGVPLVLLDSDGRCDELIPSWLSVGVDIIFPAEVGTWNGGAEDIRSKFGRNVAVFGGVNKFKLSLPEEELRAYLLTLKPCVDEGRFIPIPDHRIPPEISLADMERYCKVFKEVFSYETK